MGFKPHANSESRLKTTGFIHDFSPLKWTSAISLGFEPQASVDTTE